MRNLSRAPSKPKRRPFALGVLVATVCLAALLSGGKSSATTLTGRVIALAGDPVAGAVVTTPAGTAQTNAQGQFEVAARPEAQWVTVEHPEFLSRTRAGVPGTPLLFRLTPDDGETIALHFVGDTMFGRRFYDPNEDGDTSDGLLQPGDGPEEHFALLEQVEPLLANADVTVVNLETPLAPEPYYDLTRPRPEKFHPTKDFAFASSPAAATALQEAGVDVVDLGNNHLYDLLDEGVVTTLAALAAPAILSSFGAGRSNSAAWKPAVVTVKGKTVAFLGCTTITGSEHEISYVAEGQDKGGAATCEEEVIRQNVAAAATTYDLVVFMIHGGYEYSRAPSAQVVQLANLAREAGATLIVNHHPHVVGGFDWNGSALTAWTLGNFVFDQTVWPSFESYLLAVHIRNGKVIRAYAEPLMIEGFTPHGVAGELATYVARGAAGREAGPFVVENGAMELDLSSLSKVNTTPLPVDGGGGAGTVYQIEGEAELAGFEGEGKVRPGRDLLWTGGFEDGLVITPSKEGVLWDLAGDDVRLGSSFAFEGTGGVRLRRRARDETDVVLTPLHRILVEPNQQLSVIGMVRAATKAKVSVQLSWYPDTLGLSSEKTVETVPVADGVWQPFRFDVTAPPNAVAVGVFLRLSPPEKGRISAEFDNVRLIEWVPDGYSFSPLYDYVRVYEKGTLLLQQEVLPGAESLTSASLSSGFRVTKPLPTPE